MGDENDGLRLQDEGSNSPTAEEVPESSSTQKKKRVRGQSKLAVMAIGENNRLKVEFNELGQPIGDASIKLSTALGILAREYVPITYKSWDKVEVDIKDTLWEFVTVNTICLMVICYFFPLN